MAYRSADAGTHSAMVHDAHGFWIAEADRLAPLAVAPPPREDLRADVCVVGGGLAGLWTALHAARLDPAARVVLLEAGRCGDGPAGRNGGFAKSLWFNLPQLEAAFGAAGALAVARATEASIDALERFCDEEQADVHLARGGYLAVSTAPAEDDVGAAALCAVAAAGAPARGKVVALDADAVRARCAGAPFRGGVLVPDGATVQPALLARALRAVAARRGVAVHERSRVRAVRVTPIGVELALTGGTRVRAVRVVLATPSALAAFAPTRGQLTVGSSHVVATEPVPDVLDALGWTGGEAITDGRALVHYARATRDGRIAFGWAGGPLACGARLGGRVAIDPPTVAAATDRLCGWFPALAGRRIEHAWGGPVDIAPAHVPVVRTLDATGRVFAAFGFTGKGVGPSHAAGATLAALALDRPADAPTLAWVDPPRTAPGVPPEPLRWLGGTLVLRALRRVEAAEGERRRADPATRAIAALPRRLGVTLGRG